MNKHLPVLIVLLGFGLAGCATAPEEYKFMCSSKHQEEVSETILTINLKEKFIAFGVDYLDLDFTNSGNFVSAKFNRNHLSSEYMGVYAEEILFIKSHGELTLYYPDESYKYKCVKYEALMP